MSSKFTGFSEEDLKRIKSGETGSNSDLHIDLSNAKKLDKIGMKQKRIINKYKPPVLLKQDSDDSMEKFFDKCKLSIKTPTSPDVSNNNHDENTQDSNNNKSENEDSISIEETIDDSDTELSRKSSVDTVIESRKVSTDITPDLVKFVDNYTEDDLATHRVKLEELQLQQRLMEEQNKRRKEMISKALADRTKQTEEEVLRLEKIKRELHVLDGQFSLDVAVLRKKIDQACHSYADAEKNYLKIEKEFLNAKIHLQKEKEKKELLTEHLCALITHNETRKAQKLETLMLELATDRKNSIDEILKADERKKSVITADDDDEKPVIVDGVDQKTGKIVEFTDS